MSRHVYVVLTSPVAGREGDFNDWYDNQHMDDVLRLPGFVSAQRFRLSQTDPAQAAPQQYLAIYEVETDDIDAVNMALTTAAGTPALPLSDAMDFGNLNSWYFEAIGEKRSAS